MIKKIIKMILLVFIIFLFIFGCYLFIGKTEPSEEITWGVNFSQKQAQNLGLDWKETYLVLLEDLGVKFLKVATYWDFIESKEGEYNFEDLDWQIKKAEERGVKILLAIGMKSPRWPECHLPEWAKNLSKEKQQERILILIEKIVLRYRDSGAIRYWQVENEPFFPFGECPWRDKKFLKKEIELVKQLDSQKRPVIISDSGEGSFWITAAKFGDIVGTTMYEKVWFRQLNFMFAIPFPRLFMREKPKLLKNYLIKK